MSIAERTEVHQQADKITLGFSSVADVYATFPGLAESAPPQLTGWKRDSLEVDAYLEERAAQLDKLTLRHPTGPITDPLLHSFQIHAKGACLDPIVQDDDQLWFDTRRQADDGDVVLVLWEEALYESLRAEPEFAAFEKQHGVKYPPIMVKILVTVAGEYYLLEKRGIMPLWPNRIIGTLVRQERAGARLYEPHNPSLGPDQIAQLKRNQTCPQQ